MSRYKLIEVRKTEEKETQSIYDCETLEEATSKMHNDFGVALKQSDTLSAYCIIINNETAKYEGICTYPRFLGSHNFMGESTEKYDIRQRVYTHNDFSDDNLASYDTEQLALGNFHTQVASAMNKEECNHAIIVHLSKTGEYKNSYRYNKEKDI